MLYKVRRKMSYRPKLWLAIAVALTIVTVHKFLMFSMPAIDNTDASGLEKSATIKRDTSPALNQVVAITAKFAHFQNKTKHDGSVLSSKKVYENGVYTTVHSTHSLVNKTSVLMKVTETTNEFDDNYMMYIDNAKENELQDPYLNKHKYTYHLNNKYACNGDVLVVAIVHSSPAKKNERTAIRKSWGSVRFYLGATIVPLFLLGEPGNGETELEKDLMVESKTYKDIIQGNFIDSYRNLTYKNVMGLHWVQKYCNKTKFILKADDDTLVDVYHLVKFLFQKSPDGNLENFLYCSTFKNQGPRRDTSDKWFVTHDEYPYSKYPPYCEGFAYVMSNDVSKQMLDASVSVKYYWIDDVLVTGFLALKAGVYHRNFEHGHAYALLKSQQLPKHVQSSIFLLAKYNRSQKIWDQAWADIQTVNKISD